MRRLFLVLVLSMALGGCAARTHRMTVPLALAGDVVSTEYSLAQGNVELNPIFDTTGKRVAVSVAYGVVAIWFCEKLHNAGHHGWAKFFEGLVVVPKLALTGHNVNKAEAARARR